MDCVSWMPPECFRILLHGIQPCKFPDSQIAPVSSDKDGTDYHLVELARKYPLKLIMPDGGSLRASWSESTVFNPYYI